MAIEQSGRGRIEVFEDFLGAENPLAATVQENNATTTALLNFGPLVCRGEAFEDGTSGIVPVADALSGVGRFTAPYGADGDVIFLGTETMIGIALMAPIILECRVQMAALTARRFYMGLVGNFADSQGVICTGSTGTLTLTEANQCGVLFDSGLSESVKWYMPFKGGSATGITDASEVVSSVTPVEAEYDILRLEVDNNGTARWFINGVLEQTKAGAISTTVVHSAMIGVMATTTTAPTADVDYFYISCNRDWTV